MGHPLLPDHLKMERAGPGHLQEKIEIGTSPVPSRRSLGHGRKASNPAPHRAKRTILTIARPWSRALCHFGNGFAASNEWAKHSNTAADRFRPCGGAPDGVSLALALEHWRSEPEAGFFPRSF